MTRAFIADFKPRLPGRTRAGSPAYFRRSSMMEARESMAEVIKNYSDLIKHLKGVTPEVLRNALEPVFDKSQEYVPQKTGALRASGELEVIGAMGSAHEPEGSITYGNSEAWYAALVHEYVWLNHEPPTRAKYLQSALEEEIDSFLSSLAVDYAMALGGR